MRRFASALASAVVVVGLLATPAVAAPHHRFPAECYRTEVLCAGQHLGTAGTSRYAMLRSPDGRFTLLISGIQLTLDESEQLSHSSTTGRQTWSEVIPGSGRKVSDRATLALQHNGNLVFRADHGRTRVWSSHTAGTGHHNRLLLQNDGNLVMRTAKGKRVWSSHTTPVILVAGQQLGSGRRMFLRAPGSWNPQPTILRMSRGGDLVLKWGSRRTWHSATHVKGSVLRMRKSGRLVIVSPSHRVVWHSPALAAASAAAVAESGRLHIEGPHNRCWQLPANSAPDCSQG